MQCKRVWPQKNVGFVVQTLFKPAYIATPTADLICFIDILGGAPTCGNIKREVGPLSIYI